MTWDERIAAARARKGFIFHRQGRFTPDDRDAWRSPQTCLVGEATSQYVNFETNWEQWYAFYHAIGNAESRLQGALMRAISEHRVDTVEAYWFEIQDRALQIKRERLDDPR